MQQQFELSGSRQNLPLEYQIFAAVTVSPLKNERGRGRGKLRKQGFIERPNRPGFFFNREEKSGPANRSGNPNPPGQFAVVVKKLITLNFRMLQNIF